MYSFSQLLARNIVLSIVFVVFTTVLCALFLASYNADKQTQHQQAIRAIAMQMADNKKDIANTLRKNASYEALNISSYKGEKIYSYTNPSPSFTLPLTGAKTSKFSIKNIDLTVEYRLDTSSESFLIVKLLLALTALLVVVVFLHRLEAF